MATSEENLAAGIEPTLDECIAEYFDLPVEDVTEDLRDEYAYRLSLADEVWASFDGKAREG